MKGSDRYIPYGRVGDGVYLQYNIGGTGHLLKTFNIYKIYKGPNL